LPNMAQGFGTGLQLLPQRRRQASASFMRRRVCHNGVAA